ncbi:Mef2 protein [Starmerella bacillaris]|uniref:Mef2 protein n=1 Tax=Starmerella bacillaris TaxID=1247836 RepID=A0AAV5RI85_STABA|nr:Mef2 protein [Starmerella bacillaris]
MHTLVGRFTSRLGKNYTRVVSRSLATLPKAPQITDIRNVGIIAHIDAGKTTTTERMLYYSGVTNRIGNVDTGDTVTDFLEAERARGITIQSAAITFNWNDHQINLIDTPGHADFNYEVVRSIRVLDGCVTILDGVSGVEALTEKVWKLAAEMQVPRIVYINKMDRPGAGFSRTVREVVSKLKTKVVLLFLPYFEGEEFKGVLDVVNMLRIKYVSQDGRDVEVLPAAETDQNDVFLQARAALIDQLSEFDDAVLDEFIDTNDVQTKTLVEAIRKCTSENNIVPVLCGASFRNIGIQPLMEACTSYLPSPTVPVNSNILTMLAFKVRHDPQRGVMVFVRVYSGQLKRNLQLYNTTTKKKEKVSKLLRMQADNPVEQESFGPGEIAVLLGTNSIRTGDTIVGGPKLTNAQKSIQLQPIQTPPPVFFIRISPKSVGDMRTMKDALDILLREDPSLHLTYDEEAAQYLLSGMGELHLEIATDRLVNELNARVEIGEVMITLKETFAGTSSTVTKSSVDANGGTTTVSVTALSHDSASSHEVSPVSSMSTQIIDQNNVSTVFRGHRLIDGSDVKKQVVYGITPVLARGGFYGHALFGLDFQCEVKISPEAENPDLVTPLIREATIEAISTVHDKSFELLEPVMDVDIQVPRSTMGAVISDLSTNRRGQMKSLEDSEEIGEDNDYMDISKTIWAPVDHTMYMSKHEDGKGNNVRLQARVPLRKMVGYLSTLRSITQGRGAFEMNFSKFSPVPSQDIEDVRNQ